MNDTLATLDFAMPHIWKAYSWAVGLHGMLFVWNPTLLTGGKTLTPPPLMQVEFQEKLPTTNPPLHKALAHTRPAAKRFAAKQPLRKPRPAPLAFPNFKFREVNDMLLAQAHPSQLLPIATRASSSPFPRAKRLVSKTRGIRIQDVNFELSEPGALSEKAGGGPVVNIPLADEQGDMVTVAPAPALHAAPGDGRHTLTTHDRPGDFGGELAGRNRTGLHAHINLDTQGISDAILAADGGERGIRASGLGFEIGGPVGDRRILQKQLPEYPSWAEEKGISALVKIWFTVRPDGRINASMRILASSGYPELDSLAKEALRQWQFSPMSISVSDQAWGVITFRFTLA